MAPAHDHQPIQARYSLKDQSFNQQQSRCSSAPATANKNQPHVTGFTENAPQKRHQADDPSFGTLERSLGRQDASYAHNRAN